mmetsp:Transcript_28380/g.57643  ORF Transcript_28380/g.57643 Transcript_28380/m.57643 type:complete len:230 (+) Transcript_28380:102-791(+)
MQRESGKPSASVLDGTGQRRGESIFVLEERSGMARTAARFQVPLFDLKQSAWRRWRCEREDYAGFDVCHRLFGQGLPGPACRVSQDHAATRRGQAHDRDQHDVREVHRVQHLAAGADGKDDERRRPVGYHLGSERVAIRTHHEDAPELGQSAGGPAQGALSREVGQEHDHQRSDGVQHGVDDCQDVAGREDEAKDLHLHQREELASGSGENVRPVAAAGASRRAHQSQL